jgi:hypothetical protein
MNICIGYFVKPLDESEWAKSSAVCPPLARIILYQTSALLEADSLTTSGGAFRKQRVQNVELRPRRPNWRF